MAEKAIPGKPEIAHTSEIELKKQEEQVGIRDKI